MLRPLVLVSRDALDEAKMVEYCGRIRKSKTGLIVNRTFGPTLTYLNTKEARENFSKHCGFHSAIVVGQEMREEKCQFRIRESWGTRKPLFGQTWDGHTWIDADLLAENTLRVISIR